MADARGALADDLILDFSGLFGEEKAPAAPSALRSPSIAPLRLESGEPTPEAEGPREGPQRAAQSQQAIALFMDARQTREAHERSLEVYRAYQEHIKESAALQAEIAKGVKAGADLYSLFLKAIRAISLMTSNTGFYSQIEADLTAIHGRALGYRPPLQRELEGARERLGRLLEAADRETGTETRSRIQAAIAAHRATIEELERRLEEAQTDGGDLA